MAAVAEHESTTVTQETLRLLMRPRLLMPRNPDERNPIAPLLKQEKKANHRF